MSSLYLHVGLHKTGSTSIQYFCHLNRRKLQKSNIFYPYREQDQFSFQHANIAWLLEWNKHYDFFKILENFAGKGEIVLLSSECFMQKDRYISLIERLKDIYSSIKIIVYLRRQDQWIESVYKQVVKEEPDRKIKPFTQWIEDYLKNNHGFYYSPNWYELLEKWATYFKRENVIVRVYEKQQFINGNIFSDFVDIFKLKDQTGYTYPDKDHSHISPDTLRTEFTRLTNAFLSWQEQDEVYQTLFSVGKEQQCSFFSGSEKKELLLAFDESNSMVAKKYLNRDSGFLFNELSQEDYEMPKFTGFSQEQLLERFSKIILSKHL